ncbi:MAG: hypothetical protein FWD60_13840 [Candidatus Azobacteroides sp.]|nr:hypothetical protein [Candidatus Azobacteroides sp.]
MKTINTLTIIIFSIFGIAALIGVIFFRAYWHIGTVMICLAMICVSIWDNKREKQLKNNEL